MGSELRFSISSVATLLVGCASRFARSALATLLVGRFEVAEALAD